ncbi:MAG: hypothetical protein GF381_01500 [Candidatus Pacebacteria bacterium]|nr:hypothetical protein [Candidatus Paceibacterota bacterium]
MKRVLEDEGFSCWYYVNEEHDLVGEDLPEKFEEVFSDKAQHAIILISEEYIKKMD